MPKMKTKSAVAKRFRVSKTGKVISSRPGRGHMHAPKTAKQKRKLRERIVLTGTWARNIRRMLES